MEREGTEKGEGVSLRLVSLACQCTIIWGYSFLNPNSGKGPFRKGDFQKQAGGGDGMPSPVLAVYA